MRGEDVEHAADITYAGARAGVCALGAGGQQRAEGFHPILILPWRKDAFGSNVVF